MNYAHLNRYFPPDDSTYDDAWRRVYARLGEYTAMIVRALNMRPEGVTWLGETISHVLVRISTATEHVVLRLAPVEDLSGEIFFGRTMEAQQLPAARIVLHDLSKERVPCHYLVESHTAGVGADQIVQPYLLRSVARQAGRVLRRMHRVEAPGWGRPGPTLRRWETSDWITLLGGLHARLGGPPYDAMLFGEAERAAVAALPASPALACNRPRLTHGAFGPTAVRCTIGDHVQLEALVNPGACLGGDGLFDLAWGLDPTYPAEWREGLLEGYTTLLPLGEADQQRLRLLELLVCYWGACRRYARAEPHELARARALELLDRVTG